MRVPLCWQLKACCRCRWANFGAEDDTWEPVEHLDQQMVVAFNAAKASAEGATDSGDIVCSRFVTCSMCLPGIYFCTRHSDSNS